MTQSQNDQDRPRLLIEDWLPVAELGIESVRERAAANDMPVLSFLHIWWARRPLVASTGVILAGLLPAWSVDVQHSVQHWIDDPDHSTELRRNVLLTRPMLGTQPHESPTNAWYHDWVLHLAGIYGSPVESAKRRDEAKASGTPTKENPFNYKRAYKYGIEHIHIDLLHYLLQATWGGSLPVILDPTAGGGSIPFVAARMGLPTIANDLNSIAASVLDAGVRAPAIYGGTLVPHLQQWGQVLVDRVRDHLTPYFPAPNGENITNYIWVNSVACPRTGRLVPLLTNKWLRKGKGKEVAVELIIQDDGRPLAEPGYRIATGEHVDRADADTGTVSRGQGVSPYDHLIIDGDYIKDEAQAGRMSQVLYAVAIRDKSGTRTFRAPTHLDLEAIAAADQALAERRDRWEADGIIPTEDRWKGFSDRCYVYGITTWADMFTPRQLLVHGTFVEEFHKVIPEVHAALDLTDPDGTVNTDIANQVLMLLGLMQGKAINWNAKLSSWNINYQRMRSVFDRHDFAFKWNFAEFESADLHEWILSQLLDSYRGLAHLQDETGRNGESGEGLPRSVTITQGNAATLSTVDSGSVQCVCIDPPYYDNVMYAELSDFFYVWEKRTIGLVRPKFFTDDLADKENEAVANPARFAAMGRRRNELATADYEAKMTAIFAEAYRVLADDGVLSVMFTHKRAEAWDTLGMALIEGGFIIETSWPVHTEAEHSLHQADKNAASSTIMLVARKRTTYQQEEQVFLDDIAADVRAAARTATASFEEAGIKGVDLMLATYGPALSVVSRNWPVYSSIPDESGRDRLLRPDEALEIARVEVVNQRRKRLIGKAAEIDDLTDFVLMAWDQFKARQFPYDAARLLALAVGGQDVDALVRARIVAKKSGNVELCTPSQRVRRSGDSDSESVPGVRTEADSFKSMIDAVDTLIYVAQVDGLGPAKALLDRTKLAGDPKFLNTVQGLMKSMPRVNTKDGWTVPEAQTLDQLCSTFLPSIERPEVLDPTKTVQQGYLFSQD